MPIVFLEVEDVLIVHRNQIQLYGGDVGLRDDGLLRSAVGMARASYGGQWLHEFPHGMAAAYLFHICSNHPFVDGNKRAAFASSLAFLDLNDYALKVDADTAEQFVLKVARGEVGKDAVIEFMRQHVAAAM